MTALANSYPLGQPVRCSVAFTNTSDVATDPTTTIFRLKEPDGTLTTLTYPTDATVVRTGTGAFYVDIEPDQAGLHYYEFDGTGECEAADPGKFFVWPRDAA